MLFNSRVSVWVRVRIRFSVWLVSGYCTILLQLSVVIIVIIIITVQNLRYEQTKYKLHNSAETA